jgi:DNA-binding CsgD family transcriptional regulator
MPDNRKRKEKQPLGGLVSDDLSEIYGQLYTTGGVPKDQAEERLGGAELIHELTDRGLAHVVPHTPTGPATFRAVSPDLAVVALLVEAIGKTAQDHDRIMKCLERLREYLPGPAGDCNEDAQHAVRIITDKQEVLDLSMNLINSTQHNWMTLENIITDMPMTEDYHVKIPAALRGKIRCRAIYDQPSVEHPVMARHIERAAAEGEEARVVPSLPMKMKLADLLAALLPLSPTGRGGALLIRGSDVPVLHALRDYFELKWATATQLGSSQPPPACPLTPAQFQVLEMLAQGMTDKAIVRRLGVGESTVSRRIAEIMELLHVPGNSRFTAGIIAHQRGWIGVQEESNA